MKILFWILAVASLPASLFTSFVCYLSYGLGLAYTFVGEIGCFLGMVSLPICIIGAVIGFLNLRKGKMKKAIVWALIGLIVCALVIGSIYLDDALYTMQLNKQIDESNSETYGENWNEAPIITGLPELYQQELNKFYVAVKEEFTADQLMDLCAVTMADYYGDSSLDNIGFTLMDVNGDGVDELLIGTTSPVEEGGTAVFCLYSYPENPFTSLVSVEDEIYFLHPSDTEGIYSAEIVGKEYSWRFDSYEGESLINLTYQEFAIEPDGRLELEMTPFSAYK